MTYSRLKNSNIGCKDQESIQSSTTPDPGYQWESDKISYIIFPRRRRRDIVLASSVRQSVRPSIMSVRPHFLSVRNHISVPIVQIYFILGTNDWYYELSISYKFGQNRPLNT